MKSKMDAEYLNHLRNLLQIGLTERESKVYLTLLTRRMLTAIDLQEKVNIPRTKIYEVMQKLVNRGICIERKVGRNKFFEAVEPKIAFERIIETYQNELKRKEEVAQQLTASFTPLFNAGKDLMNPLDFIEILKDENQIQKKYINLLESTRSELLTFNKGPYVCDNPQKLKEQQIAETKLMNRGSICKNIYENCELQSYSWMVDYIKEQQQSGQQAKLIEFLPIKMVISDSEGVMLALEGPSEQFKELVMCFIKHKSFGNACKILFNHFWERGKDIKNLNKYKGKTLNNILK